MSADQTAPMPLAVALVRLQQYGERTSTWSTATYNDGTEKALHEIALTLAAEVDKLSHELTGTNLAHWEDEQDAARLRLALESAKRGRRKAREGVTELSEGEQQFLRFALELAADQMASLADEFDADDEAALESLRRLIGEDVPAPASDFFQPGFTYSDTDPEWRFRCDTVTTHPEDGERTALGWRFFRGEWDAIAYGEDDWDLLKFDGRAETGIPRG